MVRKATDLTAPEKMAQEQAGLTPQSNTGPMTLSPFERDSGLPQLPAMTPIPAKAGPEITISIGRIEVRAAPVAEHPRKPAFRPRVSLDDFLKQGDRRHP